jgi:hypothetical protein
MPTRCTPWTALRLLVGATLVGLVCLVGFDHRRPHPSPPVRLAVLVVFDQMRGDYLERWQDLFEPDGFRRLQEQGAWFQNCHYPYAGTITGPGHASLSTGTSPFRHGIVGNDWFDRAAGTSRYCVASARYDRVPPLPPAGSARTKPRPKGVAPDLLLAPTLGDALKEATGGRGRVVSLSFKDRAAVLMAGHRPDACYWLDESTGDFVTSTYFRGVPHAWVTEFNRARPSDRWFGHDWTRLRPDLAYESYSGPDDAAGEGKGIGQGRTFPHPLTGGVPRPGPKYYQALYNSPFGNELLLQLAERALDAEHLGQGETPDLLCLSFSSNDAIGHCWGPDSQEVLDVTLRSDRIVAELLQHLDHTVGHDRYMLVLSADHGVCPLPEVARSQGKAAGRISALMLTGDVERFLARTFGGEKARWLEATSYPWIYLNRKLLRERQLEASRVEEALAGWLRKQPGIEAAYTRTQLMRGLPGDDPIGQAVWRSFHPDRCGDVAVVLKPYYLPSAPLATGTTHGTPHSYDTHVPLLVYGRGVQPGVHRKPVTPQASAAILAQALGIPPPAAAEAPVPEGLFGLP